MVDDTEFMLEQWARWALVNPGVSLGYPNLTTFRRLLGSTVSTPLISDEEAGKIDQAVADLVQRDNEMAAALITFYFSNGNLRRSAEILGTTREKLRMLVKTGEAWIDARLFSQKTCKSVHTKLPCTA